MATLRLRVARNRYSASNPSLKGSGASFGAADVVLERIGHGPMQAAESPRVVEAQHLAAVHDQSQ